MTKRILIILGHPATDSYCEKLAHAYKNGAESAKAEVQWLALSKLSFDPILHQGYREAVQPLEPDLVHAQQAILWAEHLAFFYPNWWGSMPALLKGFIDRTFLPGFAFQYRKDSPLWDKLLTGRSARLMTTMDTVPWYYKWVYHQPGHYQMKRAILEFCGIKPVWSSDFGPIKGATEEQKQSWLTKAQDLGSSDTDTA